MKVSVPENTAIGLAEHGRAAFHVLTAGLLRRVLKSDNDPLAERCQRGLNPLGPGGVLWVKHPADNGFAYAKAFCKFRISHSALAHSQRRLYWRCSRQ